MHAATKGQRQSLCHSSVTVPQANPQSPYSISLIASATLAVLVVI